MISTILFLILGFIFLIKGADLLVDGSSSIAKKFGISTIVIGLTIVSFGTSAPELIVNLLASFQGSNDLALGNIIGSNISNLLLILGISAIIFPLALKKGTVYKQIPFSLIAILVLGFLLNDSLLNSNNISILNRIDGFILLGFFAVFFYYIFSIRNEKDNVLEKLKTYNNPLSILMIVLGAIGLALGGHWIIKSSTEIALYFGLSEALIGLTVIAIGTSLPELATSAVAAYKKRVDLAVGNIIGSNIFNIFWILGLSSLIKPLKFNSILNFDIAVLIGATLLLFAFIYIGKKQILERWQGVCFVIFYIIYVITLIYRG